MGIVKIQYIEHGVQETHKKNAGKEVRLDLFTPQLRENGCYVIMVSHFGLHVHRNYCVSKYSIATKPKCWGNAAML